MSEIKETVWLSLDQIKILLKSGGVRALSNDRSVIQLHVSEIDRVTARELVEGSKTTGP